MLSVGHPDITDVGIAHFKECKELYTLLLCSAKMTDAGMAFANRANFFDLSLHGKQVSDTSLALFAECKMLYSLDLRDTAITDDGLANFKNSLTTLGRLNLDGASKVTDAGLDHFSDCKNLTRLHILKTKITAAKFEELKKTHPKCRIESDHGTYEPK